MWLLNLTACLQPWNPEWSLPQTVPNDTDTETVGDPTDTVDTGPFEPLVVEVTDNITSNTTWTADTTWILKDIIYVEANSTLTVEPGTTVLGDIGSALIVTNGSQLSASGLPDKPIVFTSAQPVGYRATGNWGGVALLGSAIVAGTPPFELEGLPDAGARATYGGAEDLSSCGRLEYVRIEFAGYDVDQQGNELNGLALAGCGSLTYIDNVQVHLGLDDGIEIFGGSVNLKHALITGATDDSLDWDQGWRGRAQFVIIQQYPGIGDRGIEGDGIVGELVYQTSPTIYNMSIFGSGDDTVAQTGIYLREETHAELRNLMVAWHTLGFDIGDAGTSAGTTNGNLTISHSMWWADNAATPTSFFSSDETDDDGLVDEYVWLSSDPTNALGVPGGSLTPPNAAVTPWMPDPRGYWIPAPGVDVGTGFPVDTQDGFWDSATYRGAVAPGTVTPWWEPWAAFPAN